VVETLFGILNGLTVEYASDIAYPEISKTARPNESQPWRILIPSGGSAGAQAPWGIERIDGDVVHFRNCVVQWGDVITGAAAPDGSATGLAEFSLAGLTSADLFGVLNTNSRTLEVQNVAGGHPDHAADSELFYFQLYSLTKASGAWRVAVDWRSMPRLPIYV
jgi:hypothetical protein